MSRKKPDPEARVLRHNIWKVIRTILQVIIIAVMVERVVHVALTPLDEAKQGHPTAMTSSADVAWMNGLARSVEFPKRTDGNSFIAISYNGLMPGEKLESSIVSVSSYEEQLKALHNSGYVTISQQDVLNFYNAGVPLPNKAMLLIFEDGIYETTELAEPALREYNYLATECSFAEMLKAEGHRYMTMEEIRKLNNNTYWEMGSNGFRLGYINVFDRWANYYGHMETDEYQEIHKYLRRDYNHYLMDFLRDENRVRQESEDEMKERIRKDYDLMESYYMEAVGYVPTLYILMHSNTRAYGNDPLVSLENEENIKRVFGLNFNRQGTCINERESGPYDLSRLQSRSYFSTNHLMMRIWDDTGDDVTFVVGDQKEADGWSISGGVAEFKDDRLILTTCPYGEAVMRKKDFSAQDVDMTVTMEGNVMGCQSVVLRADEGGLGVEVALENGVLIVRDQGRVLDSRSLLDIDGGPFVSEEEEQLEGLIALQNAIIKWDKDPAKVEKARVRLDELMTKRAPSIPEGGTPYIPEHELSERDSRTLNILLQGGDLTVTLGDAVIFEKLRVGSTGTGLEFHAGVWKQTERYSQTNLADDVYDAVFIRPRIRVPGEEKELYSYTTFLDESRSGAQGLLGKVVRSVEEIF